MHTPLRALILTDVLATQRPLLRPRLNLSRYRVLRQHPTRARGIVTNHNQDLNNDDAGLLPPPDRDFPPHLPSEQEDSKGSLKVTERPSRSSLDRELEWIQDPLKLATNVIHLIRTRGEEGYEKALALVERASKSMPCTVSWNYLIDFQMGAGRIATAVRLYNDMKKRAQIPDAHTFTTLFRGFSRNVKSNAHVLEKALSIYHSMFVENAPVKPSLTHTNAVLNVCARSGNIDAVFGVAARLPVTGPGAPDKLTFTTILNAIKNFAGTETKGEHGSDALRERKYRAVLQGRRIWDEVRERWSKGDLELDEELVCAMGRLLLIGNTEQDYDDVLSLIEQTMKVPRQLARLGDPTRVQPTSSDVFDDNGNDDDNSLALTNHTSAVTFTDPGEDTDSTDIFTNPMAEFLPERYRVYPSSNTLSLAVEACTKLRQTRAAQDYWGLLTSPKKYDIVPDQENYHVYLRLLRYQRASRLAVGIVEDMHKGELKTPTNSGRGIALEHKTFRIALSTCARDMKNANALGYAERIVFLMNETLEVPDPACLVSFIDTALGHQPRDWRKLMLIARRLTFSVRTLKSLSAFSYAWTKQRNWLSMRHQEDEVLELVKKLIRVFDVVLREGREGLEQKDMVVCRDTRNELTAYVTRRMVKRQGVAGKIVRRIEKDKKEYLGKAEERVRGLLESRSGEGEHNEHRGFRKREKRPNSLV